MARLRWINLLFLGLMAGSLAEPAYGSTRDGEVHHETLESAMLHSADMLGEHGHEDSEVDASPGHQHGPAHEHGTGSDHCTHQHGTLSMAVFAPPCLPVIAADSTLATTPQAPPSAMLQPSFRPPIS